MSSKASGAGNTPLDPHKTILVVKHEGREVGRIPATASGANEYIDQLIRVHGNCEVERELDQTDGLLAALYQR